MTETGKSTTDTLRQAAGVETGKPAEPTIESKKLTFPKLLEQQKIQLAVALPKHLNADRMARIALTCFRQNPELGKCDPVSVFAAVVVGAQLGLEPGIMGQAYLVPYFNNQAQKHVCQFIPGWQGLCDLVNRSGRASVWTGAVFDGDEFEYEFGSSPRIIHVPDEDADQNDGTLTHCYAVGRVKGADYPVIEVWSKAKLMKHRDKYNKVGRRHYSFSNFEMYGRKIPLLQVLKYMPKSIELQQAVMADYASDKGQTIDFEKAIDGSFTTTDNGDGGDGGGNDGGGDGKQS